MARIKDTLRGSTMVETLVMMLVAGIVFLAVMDGLTLFTRLQTQRIGALLETGRQREGFYRLETAIAAADSVRPVEGADELAIFRSGAAARLSLRDSALIWRRGEFCDTLLRQAGRLRLVEQGDFPDTLEVTTEGYTIRFPVQFSAQEDYRTAIELLEAGYGYEE